MTNLIATLSFIVSTNWIDISKTAQTQSIHQEAHEVTTTLCYIEWKGKKKEIILEQTMDLNVCDERDIMLGLIAWTDYVLNSSLLKAK